MMKKIITIIGVGGLFCLIFFSTSCTKEYVQYPPPIDPTDTIYYSADMQPFFDGSCTNSGCHIPGGIFSKLDLSDGASYASLTSQGYIDTAIPANSSLYTKINVGGSMATYATPAQREMTLAWIEQGALNN